LTNKAIPSFQLDKEIETPSAVHEEEKIVFELIEDEAPVVQEVETVEEIQVVEAPVMIDNNELIAMTEFIKSLDVTFEIVSPEKPLDFEISKPVVADVKEIKVVDYTEVKRRASNLQLRFANQ